MWCVPGGKWTVAVKITGPDSVAETVPPTAGATVVDCGASSVTGWVEGTIANLPCQSSSPALARKTVFPPPLHVIVTPTLTGAGGGRRANRTIGIELCTVSCTNSGCVGVSEYDGGGPDCGYGVAGGEGAYGA